MKRVALRRAAMAVASALLVAAGSLGGATAAQATTFTAGGLTYEVSSPSEVTIGDGLVPACNNPNPNPCGVDESGTLTIPSSVTVGPTTYAVTRINDRAFMSQSSVLSVTIPDTITHIGMQGFYQGTPGTGLSSLTLGSGLRVIGNQAFAGTALRNLDVPQNVEEIQSAAFDDVPYLQTIEINGGTGTPVHTIGLAAFALANPGPNEDLEYVRFRGVKPTIADSAFDGHTGCQLRYQPTETWIEPFATMSDCTWISTDVPAISTDPADTTAHVGDASATFTVAATGNGDLYYQWQKDGIDLPGENSATLTVANPALTDSGDQYNVVVSNWVGPQTSSPATLTVLPAITSPATKSAQSAKVALARKLKRNRAYILPIRTAQGQPISWRTSKAGKCKVKGEKLTCRKSTGKRTATLVAAAPGTSNLLDFSQTIRRKVG